MAKRKAMSMPAVWTPPPVTREEALRKEYNDDGERALDYMVSDIPHTPTEWEKYDQDRERQKEAIREAEDKQSRRFEIDVTNKTER